MKVGLVQQCCSSDVRANVEKLKRNVTECVKMGAELVVLHHAQVGTQVPDILPSMCSGSLFIFSIIFAEI